MSPWQGDRCASEQSPASFAAMNADDRALGLSRPITRRDFVHDVGLAGFGLALPWAGLTFTPGSTEPYYPPTLTGLRGSHRGSFEVAHAFAREGKRFENPRVLDELYDLIVVGGGISGLAAAYFHRKLHGTQSRILILDNHDDFGGHAKRRVPPGRADAPRLGRHRQHGVPGVQRGRERPHW